MDKYIVFIPARGGSKSIPLKNINNIAGKPLIFWTIEAAINCDKVDRVYLSTDSEQIIRVAKQIKNKKFEIVQRSSETATDLASTESAMLEFSNSFSFENIILIQPTSPLLTSKDIESAIIKYEDSNVDSLLSVVEQKRFMWDIRSDSFVKPLNYNPLNRPRRQDFNGFLVENGALYITGKNLLQETKSRISGNIACYKMPEETYYEIDEPSDWIIVERLLLSRKNANNSPKNNLNNVKLLVTDVDGVLTDCGMYYTEKGDEIKKFNTRDGMGFQLCVKKELKLQLLQRKIQQLLKIGQKN